MAKKKSDAPITDKGYQGIADDAYDKEYYNVGEVVYVDTVKNPDGSWEYEEWEVVDVLENEKHDVHAIAVKRGDEVVISYRGTKTDSFESWGHSIQKNFSGGTPREDIGRELRNEDLW